MVLVLLTVTVSVALGYARGGRLRNLAHAELHALWLVAVAVFAQVVLSVAGERLGTAAGPALLAVSHVALLAYIWMNRLLPGMTLVFLGFALNALVITANGAMPVSEQAMRVLAEAPEEIEFGKHRVLDDGDPFWYLADVLPIPVLRTIVSVGDVLLAAGVGILVVALMRRDQRSAQEAIGARAGEPS